MNHAALEQAVARRFGLRKLRSWTDDLPRIVRKLRAAGRVGADDLERSICSDSAVLREVAGALTVTETFFFRHAQQIVDAVEHLQSLLQADARRRCRIWCAGCSSGEEPYSLLMALSDRLNGDGQRIDITACDVSGDALQRARIGEYGEWSFRGVDTGLRERHFISMPNRRYRVRTQYLGKIRFEHLSIQELARVLPADSLDVVFFRNVGVYLEVEALRECYSAFRRVLRADGILVQASTDPTPPRALFERSQRGRTCQYRVRRASTDRVDVHPVRSDRLAVTSVTGSLPAPTVAPAPKLNGALIRGAPRTSHGFFAPEPPALVPSEHEVRGLGDRGHIEDALALVEELLQQRPNSVEPYLLRAQLRLAGSQNELAVADLRRILFLAPSHRLARYWYGVLLGSLGRTGQALCQLRELEKQLESASLEMPVEDGTTRAGDLLRAVSWLRTSME